MKKILASSTILITEVKAIYMLNSFILIIGNYVRFLV